MEIKEEHNIKERESEALTLPWKKSNHYLSLNFFLSQACKLVIADGDLAWLSYWSYKMINQLQIC